MKLASCFLISVAFHAAILTFPVSLFEAGGERVTPVIVVSLGEGGGPALPGKSSVERSTRKAIGGASRQGPPRIQRPGNPSIDRASEREETSEKGNQVSLLDRDIAAEEFVIGGLNKTGVEGTQGLYFEVSPGIGEAGGSSGWGNSEIGVGPGGEGEAGGSAKLVFAQANYAHAPKPGYPEPARREGWEGTVLLRVLVNPQGKAERIELRRSSGFEMLDRAALETVKEWRFHPARYGERQVESWVQIPIVFRLSDRDRGS